MTNVTIYTREDYYMGCKAHGHAGMDEAGYDIVCAAISVLVTNTINAIDEFTEDAFSSLVHEEDATIDFSLKSKPSKQADLLLRTLVLGLQGICSEYQEYINISFEEV